jgi:predicted O-methyltransferase YrrM
MARFDAWFADKIFTVEWTSMHFPIWAEFVSPYGSRVEKIRRHSLPALHQLVMAGRLFDLIYVDGSHRRDDVIMDSLLAWRLLKEGGLLIWDDYLCDTHLPAAERPQQAIDTFLKLYADEIGNRSHGLPGARETTHKCDIITWFGAARFDGRADAAYMEAPPGISVCVVGEAHRVT